MTSFNSEPIVLQADQDHAGIRLLVLLSMAFALWLAFLLVTMIMERLAPGSDYTGLISCLGALPIALGAVMVLEKGLKRIWPSGRHLSLDDRGIKVNDRDQLQQQFHWDGNLTQLKWFFQLKGYQYSGSERRVPKKWLCLACQIQQDENRLIVYSFFSIKDAKVLFNGNQPEWRFHQINPGELPKRSSMLGFSPPRRPEIPASVLAGSDGRYWLAERRRWGEGLELTSADFKTFVQRVQAE